MFSFSEEKSIFSTTRQKMYVLGYLLNNLTLKPMWSDDSHCDIFTNIPSKKWTV